MSLGYVFIMFTNLKINIGNNRTETEVFAGSGRKGHKDGIPHESTFNGPFGIAIDEKTKECFVVDNGNNRIRVIY